MNRIMAALRGSSSAIPLIQGPLAGVSNRVFRELVWEYSDVLLVYSEMISVKTILHGSDNIKKRYLERSDKERCLGYQISGDDPLELAQAVQVLTKLGADTIDLNCGCPVKKIRKRGQGSRLLGRPEHLRHLIQVMKDHTDVPVSVKIRVDGGSEDAFNDSVIEAINSASPDFITVHGRHYTHRYDKPCLFEEIQYFVEHITCPVVGNGDVKCPESLRQLKNTGCAGAMISRAGVGQPWLFNNLQRKDQISLSPRERGLVFLKHIKGLCQLFDSERFGVYQARGLAKYYARDLALAKTFVMRVNEVATFEDLQRVCEELMV